MTDALFQTIASTGVVGVFLVLTLLALRSKDNDLTTEKNARIDDAQKFNTLCLALQKEVILAITTLSNIAERTEKKEEERDRNERERLLRHETPQHDFIPQMPSRSGVKR